MTLAISILALLVGGASLGCWARRLDRWEADLAAREAALESARVARQEQLVALAAERMELVKAQAGSVYFPMPGARA